MAIKVMLVAMMLASFQAKAQDLGSLNIFSKVLKWVDSTEDYFNTIRDKHKREEASDRLTYLLNDIDVLYANQRSVLSIIARTDSADLHKNPVQLSDKNDLLMKSLQIMSDDFKNILPLLNGTIPGSATDSLLYAINENFYSRGAILRDYIAEYIMGSGHVSKMEALRQGNVGLNLLLQTKSKLSLIIAKLSR